MKIENQASDWLAAFDRREDARKPSYEPPVPVWDEEEKLSD